MRKGNLFTEYFLREGIRHTEDWRRLDKKNLVHFKDQLKIFLQDFSQRLNPDEADTEDGLIVPILRSLGFHFSRQKAIGDSRDMPDFILFASKEDKAAFDRVPRKKKPWHRAVAILEGKRWERSLDRGDRSDPFDPHAPSSQILRYLSLAESISGGKLLWGILTNGRLWRLYYHRASSRAEGFLEIDLKEIFCSRKLPFPEGFLDPEHLLYLFQLFFRCEAFVPAPWRPYKTFLEIALAEGKRWEERVSADLRDKIFGQVFPKLAKGFLEEAKRRELPVSDDLLDRIYETVLVLLYRLLFLLYAEDRDLLPVRSEAYRRYSLSTLREEAARLMDKGMPLSSTATTFWDRLKGLFRIVALGDPGLGVPPYNGGLFESQRAPLLEEFSLADAYFVPALDQLSRDHALSPPRRINYRDLSVRQLGSLYEGLLEFKLKIAEEDLEVRKEKNREVYRKARNTSRAVIKSGEPYLTNDRAERKATGTYYTPDYIVRYIVKETLDPHIRKALKDFNEEVEKLKSTRGLKAAWKTTKLKEKDPVVALLKLRILDPAMGSGHFLVGAVDYLADRLLELIAEVSEKTYFGTEKYESPVVSWLEELRNNILSRAKEQGFSIPEEALDDRHLIRRLVLKRCLYGVDLNPLTVELAKLSLWLHTFTVGAPLSFLDHHLRRGNALIGADPKEVEKARQEMPLFGARFTGVMSAVSMLERLCEIPDTDLSEVDESKKLHDQVLTSLKPYKRLLDLYLARQFLPRGPSAKQVETLDLLLSGARGDPLEVVSGKIKLSKEDRNFLCWAFDLAEKKGFFHWALEFPEVWYESGRPREHGGFNVIFGNPPYVRIQELRRTVPEEVEFIKARYRSAKGSFDLYVPFVERGLGLLSAQGKLGFILGSKFTKLDYGEGLREIIAPHLYSFIDFGDRQVFARRPDEPSSGQTTYTALLFLDKIPRDKAFFIKAPDEKKVRDLADWLESLNHEDFYAVPTAKLGRSPWVIVSREEEKILRRMEEDAVPLGKLVENIIVGIQTSADEVYILELLAEEGSFYRVYSKASGEERLLEKGLLKPLVSGEDIERYFVHPTKKLLLFPYRLLPIGEAELVPPEDMEKLYPRTWAYLREHEKRLRGRERGKFDNHKWYRFGRTQNIDKHERPKLGVAQTVKRLEVFADHLGRYYFHNVRVNGILLSSTNYSLFYLLALLNSRALDFYFKRISVPHRGGHYAANKQFLSPLPIKTINFKDRNKEILFRLKAMFDRGEDPWSEVLTLSPTSGTVHDFLAYLAQEMSQILREAWLLEHFAAGSFAPGSKERLEVLDLLTRDNRFKNNASEVFLRELASHLAKERREKFTRADLLVDRLVNYLYGFEEADEILNISLLD